jgi:hypothetical protein
LLLRAEIERDAFGTDYEYPASSDESFMSFCVRRICGVEEGTGDGS